MGLTMSGSALFHFAAGMAGYSLTRAQASARLAQGRATQAERQHVDVLLDACRDRFAGVAREAATEQWLNQDFTKCESANVGLRKTLLKRPWCPRCSKCGVRHEDIEFSTCKFWQAWVV